MYNAAGNIIKFRLLMCTEGTTSLELRNRLEEQLSKDRVFFSYGYKGK
jgi:hypothetical protein